METYIQHRLGETAVATLNKNGEMVAYTLQRHNTPSWVGAVFVARVHEVNKTQSFVVVDLGTHKAILNGVKKLTEGQKILVQGLRDGFQHKMPAVHTRISAENAYFIVNSTGKDVSFDRAIGHGKARADLLGKLSNIIGNDTGIFVKKNSLHADAKTLQSAYTGVKQQLTDILNTPTKRIQLVRPAPSIIEQTILSVPYDCVVVADTLETLNLIKIAQQKYKTQIDIRHYKQGDVFKQGGIYDMVDSLLYRTIDLPNGGSVVFDSTEALSTIDVNMGNIIHMNKGDEAVFKFNKTACGCIAQHIVLRNISGLIVIDFVRLQNRGMMKQIPKILQSYMRTFDPNGVWDVLDITKAGLVEMTRKRTRPSLADVMLSAPQDRPKNPETVALELLQHLYGTVSVGTPTIFAPQPVISVLKKSQILQMCENKIKNL